MNESIINCEQSSQSMEFRDCRQFICFVYWILQTNWSIEWMVHYNLQVHLYIYEM